MQSGLVSAIKNRIVHGGTDTYVVPLGLYRGIKLELDLRYNFQLFTGLWELETHRYLDKWTDYEWAIDVGAGGGELCLYMLKHKPNIKQIFAVEPDKGEVFRMKRNFQLNPDIEENKVTIVDRCVGAGTEKDELRLDGLGNGLGSSRGLIKIDVDGYEIEVLKGADGLLRGGGVDLLLETHTISLEEQSIKVLGSYGFATKVIKNGWYPRILPEQRPVDHNRWLWASKRARA
jgi:hypothetical protein